MTEETKGKLEDLREEVFNSEDIIDGCYYSKAEDLKEFTEINEAYTETLKALRKLNKLLDDALSN